MARPLRIEYPGAWYHVMNRGLCRREVFHAEEYAQLFYELLQEAHERYQIEVHAYCLMGNHYHLCVRTPYANLGKAMRHINSMFTRKYNYINKLDGPLFRGRYKAILVEEERYLLQLFRYIHLNPVSAGIVENPKDYLWSSYKFLWMDEKIKPNWLYLNEILKYFKNKDKSVDEDMHANLSVNLVPPYEKFVLEGIDDETKSFFKKKKNIPIMGSNEFVEKIRKTFKERKENKQNKITEIPEMHKVINYPLVKVSDIISVVANYYKIEEELVYVSNSLQNKPKKVAIYLAVQMSGENQSKIATHFDNVSYYWVSKAYLQIKSALKEDVSLNFDILNIKKILCEQKI